MNQLVFVTNNSHKLKEITQILEHQFKIISLSEIGCHDDIPEDFFTLEENALAKARYVKTHYGYDCFADDSGLEIEALDGRPGVHSARYAGEGKNSEDNMDKVLCEMMGKSNRSAKFRTVIALILNGNEYLFEGAVTGEILTERHGHEGFGYDPIFRPEGFAKTFAEMNDVQKNAISHRGRAVEKLVDFLNR